MKAEIKVKVYTGKLTRIRATHCWGVARVYARNKGKHLTRAAVVVRDLMLAGF